ncbi:MAG: hypothetical protein KJO11_15700 [Gemmatimonadetes bacterium]|nr:hypothetical protein [Gemmatimonadota bacterium]MBT8403622.1 hypothetical protein [Gemmatimonadota bacterium]NNK62227.1 hypothetical protein [Gemmatimonadota bacterium]
MRHTIRRIARIFGALIVLAGAGCTTSVTGPGDTAGVRFELRVTGGIAGVDYRIRVDGVDRLVRIDCTAFCPDPAPAAMALGADQWASLVLETRAAGLPGLEDEDYGGTCCDFFHFDLTVQDGLRSARVLGDAGTLPAAIAQLVERLLDLGVHTVPALYRAGVTPGYGPGDALDVSDVRVEGERLVATVTYSGGCRAHEIDLRFSDIWMESAPVQTIGWFTHEGRDDPCDALPSETRGFDLAPLVEAYRTVYPQTLPGERIRIRLRVPGGTEVTTVEVTIPQT